MLLNHFLKHTVKDKLKKEDNNMSVSIISCKDYDEAYSAVKKSIDLLGGIKKFVSPGERVLIKPNLVSRKNPDEAATTHPAVVNAVVRLVEEAEAVAVIAESPGGIYNTAILKSLYAGCGINDAVKGTNAELNYDTSFKDVSLTDGHVIKSTSIIMPVLDCDKVISVAKMKTHAMTAYTGAVKNLFGCIPGTYKAELHFRLDDRDAFCGMLVDLYEYINPVLSVMDGVWGMEGDGPTSGVNRFMGIVMASPSGHEIDLAATHMMGYAPDEVVTVKNAISRKLIPDSALKLDVLGDSLESHMMTDIVKPKSHFNLLRLLSLPPGLNKKLTKVLAAKPKVNKNECIGCGECMRCCPPKAIVMKNKKPVIDEGKCIKCFCCQELCPAKAMKIHRPVMNRIMLKFLN